MADTTDLIEKGLISLLTLASETPYEALTLADIAGHAGIPLSDFHGKASKQSLTEAIEPHFDKVMTSEGIDPEETPRERLFDVIMLRFEAMEAHRQGLLTVMSWRDRQVLQLAKLVAARKASADWALVAAGLDSDEGVPRDVRAVAVAWVIGKAERAWRKETDPGFARTMAALDGELRKMEERAGWLKRFTGGPTSKSTAPPADAEPDYKPFQ